MKHLFSIFLCHFLFYGTTLSQNNLIQNPGFEQGITVTGQEQLHFATGWNHAQTNYISNYSSDLFEVGAPCAQGSPGSYGSLNIPSNKWSLNLPAIEGVRYAGGAGLWDHSSNPNPNPEACIGTLEENLKACDIYEVKFWHAPADVRASCNPHSFNTIGSRSLTTQKMRVTLRKSSQPGASLILNKVQLNPVLKQWDEYGFQFSLTEQQAMQGWDRIEFVVENALLDLIYFIDNVSLINKKEGPCDEVFEGCFTGAETFCENEPIVLDASCSDFHNRHYWKVYDATNGWDNRGPAIIGPIWGIEPGDETTSNLASQLDLTNMLSSNGSSEKCYYVELGIQKWCCGRLINGVSEVKEICISPTPGPYISTVYDLPCEDDCITIGYDVSSDPAGPLSVLWDDGTTTHFRTVCPTETSEYNVTYTNSYGCTAEASFVVNVEKYDVTDIEFEGGVVCVGEPFCLTLEDFEAEKLNFIDNIYFSFDEYITSDDLFFDLTDENSIWPSLTQCYTYSTPGSYRVKVVVNGPCGSFEVWKRVVVNPIVNSVCTYVLDCESNEFVDLTDRSLFQPDNCCPLAALYEQWSIKDEFGNTIGFVQDPTHAPVNILTGGYFEIEYTSFDNCTKCVFKVYCSGAPGPHYASGADLLPQDTTDIAIEPNPSYGNVVVKMNNGHTINKFEVINLEGKIIKKIENSRSTNKMSINLSMVPKGVYVIRVTGGGTVLHTKFILK